jgi:hypothetical protein
MPQDKSPSLDGKEQVVAGAREQLNGSHRTTVRAVSAFSSSRGARRARPRASSTCLTASRSTLTEAGEQPPALGCPLPAAKGSMSPGPRLSSVLPPNYNQSFTVVPRIDRTVVERGCSAWFRYLMSLRPGAGERENRAQSRCDNAAVRVKLVFTPISAPDRSGVFWARDTAVFVTNEY